MINETCTRRSNASNQWSDANDNYRKKRTKQMKDTHNKPEQTDFTEKYFVLKKENEMLTKLLHVAEAQGFIANVDDPSLALID